MKQFLVIWFLENGTKRKSNDLWSESEIIFLKNHFGVDIFPAYTRDGVFISNWKEAMFNEEDIVKVYKFTTEPR